MIRIAVDYDSDITIEYSALSQEIYRIEIPIEYKADFIYNQKIIKLNKTNIQYNLFKIKIYKYLNAPFKINFYTNIYEIKNIPYNFHIESNNS